MPCMTYETPAEIARATRLARERDIAPLREAIALLRVELQERDAMLCGVMHAIYDLDKYIQTNMILEDYFSGGIKLRFDEAEAGVTWHDLQIWWADHKAADEQRKQAQAAALAEQRAQALAKLTPAEREILGL